MVDSKDAKSIIPGDIAPVQKPGKRWKQRSGIWEQGRANALKGAKFGGFAWCNKYTTVVFCEGDNWKGKPQQQIHCQPLPDYMRWFASGGELHYLPNGSWDTVTGCYIPSYCLDLAYVLMPKPTKSLLRSLALLCWVNFKFLSL